MLNCTDLECILHHHHYYAHLHHLKHGTHGDEGGEYPIDQTKILDSKSTLPWTEGKLVYDFPVSLVLFAYALVIVESFRASSIICLHLYISVGYYIQACGTVIIIFENISDYYFLIICLHQRKFGNSDGVVAKLLNRTDNI